MLEYSSGSCRLFASQEYDFLRDRFRIKLMNCQVKQLAPLHVREVEKAVPILTTDEGIGERHIREDVISPISG